MLRRMLRDCIPTMIALTFSGLYSVIDGLFIGNAAGDTGLAAINLAWPIPAFITAIGLGVGTGGSILFSNAKGKGEEAYGRSLIKTTMGLLFSLSILSMLLLGLSYPAILKILGAGGEVLMQAKAYSRIMIFGSLFQIGGAGLVPILRSLSKPVGAMSAMVCGMLSNCGLNYLLIIRCDMGIKGAAIGSITAQAIVCVICLFQIVTIKKVHQVHSFSVMEHIFACKKILKTGFAAFGVSLAPTVVLMFTNWQCLRIGGKAAVAAYAVISYLVFPIQSLLQGIGDGLQPMMSYYVGAGKQKELNCLRRYAYVGIGLLGICAFFVSCLVKEYVGGWFHLSKDALRLFEQGFFISATSFLFYGYSKFHVAFMNANLKVAAANGLIYGECLVVSPVLIFCMPLLWGITGVWLSLPLTSVMMLILFFGLHKSRERKRGA